MQIKAATIRSEFLLTAPQGNTVQYATDGKLLNYSLAFSFLREEQGGYLRRKKERLAIANPATQQPIPYASSADYSILTFRTNAIPTNIHLLGGSGASLKSANRIRCNAGNLGTTTPTVAKKFTRNSFKSYRV